MCEFCEKWKEHETLYQENAYCNLLISKVMNIPLLVVENIHKGCPKYADCSVKGRIKSVAFKINYCPNCGERLSDEM